MSTREKWVLYVAAVGLTALESVLPWENGASWWHIAAALVFSLAAAITFGMDPADVEKRAGGRDPILLLPVVIVVATVIGLKDILTGALLWGMVVGRQYEFQLSRDREPHGETTGTD
jgi:hypothetical protein